MTLASARWIARRRPAPTTSDAAEPTQGVTQYVGTPLENAEPGSLGNEQIVRLEPELVQCRHDIRRPRSRQRDTNVRTTEASVGIRRIVDENDTESGAPTGNGRGSGSSPLNCRGTNRATASVSANGLPPVVCHSAVTTASATSGAVWRSSWRE